MAMSLSGILSAEGGSKVIAGEEVYGKRARGKKIWLTETIKTDMVS